MVRRHLEDTLLEKPCWNLPKPEIRETLAYFLTQHKQQSAPRKSKVHECYSMLLMDMKTYYEYYDHVKKKVVKKQNENLDHILCYMST